MTQRNCHIISHQCCRRQWPRLNRPPKQKGRQKARSKSLRNISIKVPQPIQALIVGNMTFNGKKLSISPVKLSTLSHFPLLHLPSPTSFTLLASTVALCSLSSGFSKTWQGMICEEIKKSIMNVFCNLLRRHLGSSPNPYTCNLTRRSSLDSTLLCYISLSSGLWNIMIDSNTQWTITEII